MHSTKMTKSDLRLDSLIAQAQTGDRSALGRLLELHRGYLKLLSKRLLDSWLAQKEDESDLAQETMADAIRDFEDFDGESEAEFLAWLRRMLDRNTQDRVKHYRRKKRDAGREISQMHAKELSDESVLSPSHRLLRDEDAVLLAQAMEELTELQREAVRLRHLEGWSLAEVAESMGKSYNAVAQLILAGLKKLRQSLDEDQC